MIAYRVSEDERVLTPTMVDIDGFYCSHLTEPVNVPTEEEAEQFIKEFKTVNAHLDTDTPYAMNNLTSPGIFTEIKRSQDLGMRSAAKVLDEKFEEFGGIFGRRYGRIMCDDVEGADTVLLCMGSMSGTAKHAVKLLRAGGRKVGICRVVAFRPFPTKEVAAALNGAKNVAVIDRVSAMGSFGPLYEEVLASMKLSGNSANDYSFVAGLGGRDIWEQTIENVVDKAEELGARGEPCEAPIWIDLKEKEVVYNA